VAEHAITLSISLLKDAVRFDRAVKVSDWLKGELRRA